MSFIFNTSVLFILIIHALITAALPGWGISETHFTKMSDAAIAKS